VPWRDALTPFCRGRTFRGRSVQNPQIVCGKLPSIAVRVKRFRATRTHLRTGNTEESADFPFESNGYNYQASEIGRCLRDGRLESEIMPLEETIVLMQIMDELRTQGGLKYPME